MATIEQALMENEMQDPTTTTEIYSDASGYWKICTIVLGIGFLIAVASHGGPAKASASSETNLLSFHQSQAAAIKSADEQQTLSIGGFDMVNSVPMFVIINEDGQRVGTLPMSVVGTDDLSP